MRVDFNPNNTNFTSKSVSCKKVARAIKLNNANSNKASDSVLLYFAGLLDTLGLKKPLSKLMDKLHS